jgi:hypothetical protein
MLIRFVTQKSCLFEDAPGVVAFLSLALALQAAL